MSIPRQWRLRALTFFLAAVPLWALAGCGSPIVGQSCADGFTRCGDRCVDLSADPGHCGTCSLSCSAGDVCASGDCAPADGGVFDAGDAGDAEMPDAGDGGLGDGGTPDGSMGDGSMGDGGLPDGGLPDGGSCVCDLGELCCDLGCVRPQSDPNDCGGCGIRCGAAEVCSAGACAAVCDPGFTFCSGRCFDLANDPNHCGSCTLSCPSGICIEGACEAATGGHLVVIGHDYRNSRRDMNRIVGNAVFLARGAPVRVLVYEGSSRSTSLTGVDRAIDQTAVATGRTWTRTVTDIGKAPLLLADADVFVLPSQQDAADAVLAEAGGEWSLALRSFLRGGGVVVLMDGGSTINAGTWQILDAAGLFSATGIVDVSLDNLTVIQRTDAVALGMPAMYRAERSSVRFLTTEGTVVVTHPGGPVVIHRLVIP